MLRMGPPDLTRAHRFVQTRFPEGALNDVGGRVQRRRRLSGLFEEGVEELAGVEGAQGVGGFA